MGFMTHPELFPPLASFPLATINKQGKGKTNKQTNYRGTNRGGNKHVGTCKARCTCLGRWGGGGGRRPAGVAEPISTPLFSSISSLSCTFLALSLHPLVHVGSARQMGG